uniref:Putative secreted protein n=1 Tax=Panstrongylus lignarius TaxID=156445 RepID=A0A224Y1L4_9HEMI
MWCYLIYFLLMICQYFRSFCCKNKESNTASSFINRSDQRSVSTTARRHFMFEDLYYWDLCFSPHQCL